MHKLICTAAVAAVAAWIGYHSATAGDSRSSAAGPLLSHSLFFSLQDDSEASRQKLMELCKKYLSPHPGIVFFACGTPNPNLKGNFNDRDFDVAVQMVFADEAALHTYAKTDLHQEFIAEVTSLLKGLRIFDANVERVAVPDDAAAGK